MDSLIVYYSLDKYLPLIAQIMSSTLNTQCCEIREILQTPGIIKKLKSYLNIKENILPISQPLYNKKSIIILTPLLKNSIIPAAVVSFLKQYELSNKTLSLLLCYKDKSKFSENMFLARLEDLNVKCQNTIILNINEKTMNAIKNFDIKFILNNDNILQLQDPQNINTI